MLVVLEWKRERTRQESECKEEICGRIVEKKS